jgi:hypothetical protein
MVNMMAYKHPPVQLLSTEVRADQRGCKGGGD